jgi:hypothetical protein
MAEIESKAYPQAANVEMRCINWVRIEKADNGYIVKWDEKEHKPAGSMEHCDYVEHKKLFGAEEGDAAWAKFRELKEAEWAHDAAMKSM